MKSVVAFALSWVAAWCQVVVVATMPWSALAPSLDPLADVPICHADAQQGQQPPHNGRQSRLCPLCDLPVT